MAAPLRLMFLAIVALLIAACTTLPAAPKGTDAGRIARWNADLDVVRDRFLGLDRSYSPAERAVADARLIALRAQIAGASDAQVAAELARIAALAGNAHTRAYLLRNRGVWRRYPVRLWRFEDGWRVVAARGDALPLLGGRVTAIGGGPADALGAALRPLFAGNASWAEYMASYTLTSPEALAEALPATAFGDAGELVFAVELDGRARSVRVQPLPPVRRDVPEESWWFLSPAHPALEGWRHVLTSAPTTLPASLDGAAGWYDARRCEGDVVYLQFNRAGDAPGREPIAAWGDRLLADLRARPPRRLLIDLRFNTGGDLTKAQPLFEAIAALPLANRLGAIAILSDVATFSAGLTPLAWLRSHTRAQVVGRHPGDNAIFWAEGGNVVLPHSGIVMHYANGLHVYAEKGRAPGDATPYLAFDVGVQTLAPDIVVGWRWADYITGRDPAAEAALGEALRCRASG